MANRFQVKRTTTSGLLPNVSNSSNTSYIAAGELAINLTDRKLLSSNGSATFEVGANLASISVGGALTGNSTGLYHTGTINAASFTVGATVVANSTAVFATRLNSKTEGNLNVNNAITSGAVTVTDTRAAQTTPETLASPLVDFDFKQNTTEGLSDGGTYFGEMTFRPYGTTTDWTGGPSHQLGFTSNNNVYHRNGTSTSWGAWARLYKEGTVLAAGNTTITGFANVSSTLAAGNTTITGFITATGDITAFFSDDRLKDRYSNIPNAVEKVKSLNGFYYEPNITAQDLGYQKEMHVGVSAQEVNAIMPEVVAPAPIDNKYLTVKYDRLIPLLIEAIKEQQIQIDELKAQLKKD
jgi:uncharacterized metal-binding protein